jgi:integrase
VTIFLDLLLLMTYGVTYVMAKTSGNPRIVNRTVRAKLSPRRDPYWHLIAEGQHLGYRRLDIGGTWVARYYTREHGRRFQALGVADDTAPANGTHLLSFADALQAAQGWFATVTRADANGVHIGPYTVDDAATAWLDKWKGSARSKATSKGNVTHHILPTLGQIELSKLSRETINGWLHDLAQKPPMKVLQRQQSTKKLSPSRRSKIVYDPNDPETQRKRKDTANRVFNDLRALLSQAYMNDKVASEKAWKTVNKLEGTAKVSSEGLSLDEAPRFIATCPSDFLILVQAALITGCRYDDLCKLKVRAYVPRLHAVEVKQGKTGEWQRSYLSDDEEAFFVKHTSDKQADDYIFLRGDGKPWGKSHQQERMKDALKAAKINRHIRFHDLRHTLGQWLAESGMDMKVISKQLGHSSVRVTEKHYVQYTPEFLAKTVRENKPSFLGNV